MIKSTVNTFNNTSQRDIQIRFTNILSPTNFCSFNTNVRLYGNHIMFVWGVINRKYWDSSQISAFQLKQEKLEKHLETTWNEKFYSTSSPFTLTRVQIHVRKCTLINYRWIFSSSRLTNVHIKHPGYMGHLIKRTHISRKLTHIDWTK